MNDCLEQLRTLDPRMAEAVVVDGATGCWVWQLSCTRDGYPLTYPNKRTTRAHRRGCPERVCRACQRRNRQRRAA